MTLNVPSQLSPNAFSTGTISFSSKLGVQVENFHFNSGVVIPGNWFLICRQPFCNISPSFLNQILYYVQQLLVFRLSVTYDPLHI